MNQLLRYRATILLPAIALAACNRSPTGLAGSGGSVASVAVSGHVNKADWVDLTRVLDPQDIEPQFTIFLDDGGVILFAALRKDPGLPLILKKDALALSPAKPAATGPATTRGGPRGSASHPVTHPATGTAPATETAPATMGSLAQAWRIAQVGAPRQEWVYAAQCASRQELWGVLDQSGEDKAEQLTLLRSTDGGANWDFFSGLKKPAAAAVFAGFALDDKGQGRLSLFLADDTDEHIHGFYHYRTTDGGKTWTGPTEERNDTNEGEQAGSDDTLEDVLRGVQENN